MREATTISGAVLALTLAACPPSPSDLTGGYSFFPRNPTASGAMCNETQNVVLISDTHAHHIYTRGDIYQTRLGADMSPAALRAPQSDVYAHVLESYLIKEETRVASVLLHLGDTVDISCEDEFGTFQTMIASSQVPFFLAPGNHDGFHFGVDDAPETRPAWSRSCDTSKPMPRDVFLKKYLALLKTEKGDQGIADLATQFPTVGANQEEFRFAGAPGNAVLQRAAWHIFEAPDTAPGRWSSYVLQEVDLTATLEQRGACGRETRRVLGILIDTSSYEEEPGLLLPVLGGTGNHGQISREEQGVIQQWVDDAKREDARVVIFGHHPSTALDSGSRDFLLGLRPVMYVSSHDHNGKWIAFGTGDSTTLELNIGSMIDPPIDVRTFTLRSVGDRLLVDSPLERFETNNNLSEALIRTCAAHGADMPEPWEAAPGDADFYLTYNQLGLLSPVHTAEEIMNVVIASRARFARLGHISGGWPTDLPLSEVGSTVTDGPAHRMFGPSSRAKAALTLDAKEALLMALSKAMDQAVTDPAGLKEQFEECQHYWASQYHQTGRRLPPVDDWTVFLPKDRN